MSPDGQSFLRRQCERQCDHWGVDFARSEPSFKPIFRKSGEGAKEAWALVLGLWFLAAEDQPPGGETCTLNGQGAEWETLRYYHRKPVGSTAPFGTCGVRPVFCSSAPPVCRRLPGGGKACQQNGRRETLTIIRPRHILVLAGWIRPPVSAQEGRETSQISQVLLSSSPWSIQARYAADR
jgi:hypothetical protein